MRSRFLPALTVLLLSVTAASAWSEPPVTSARDAACRDEARSKVFTAPDPEGTGLFATGKRIYTACMAANPGKANVASAASTR